MPEIVCEVDGCGEIYDTEVYEVCPNCKTRPHHPDAVTGIGQGQDAYNPDEEAAPQILLEYRHLKLEQSQHGTIPLNLTNLNDYPIREINFCAKSPAFLEGKIEKRITTRMAEGAAIRHIPCNFDIADRTGPYGVEITITAVDDEGNKSGFTGLLNLYIREKGYQPPKLDISGSRIIGNDIDIEGAQDAFRENRIVGSKITIRQPKEAFFGENTDWLRVSIEFDQELTEMIGPEPDDGKDPEEPEKVAGSKAPKAVLAYTRPSDNTPKTIHLRTGKSVMFGRLNEKSDVVSIRLPHTKENQQVNRYIGGRHFAIHTEGFKDVFLEDQKSMNGTYLNGKKVEKPTRLRHHDVISLAKVLTLKYYAFRDFRQARALNENLNNCRTMLDCTVALASLDKEAIRSNAPLDAILLKRTDGFKDRLEYLFVVRSADIGSGLTVPVMIRHKSIDQTHARIVFDGQYYITDLNSKRGTFLNEKRLEPYHREVLRSDDQIRVGDVTMTFGYLNI